MAHRSRWRVAKASETLRPPLGPLTERDKERGREGGYWIERKAAERAPSGRRGYRAAKKALADQLLRNRVTVLVYRFFFFQNPDHNEASNGCVAFT